MSTQTGPNGPGAPTQPMPGQQYPQQGDGGYGAGPQFQGSDGPGMQERAAQAAHTVGRHIKTPETKEFFKTSEFVVWALTVLALLIAGVTIGDNGGGDDNLKAATVWTLVTITSAAYIISRGISKAATKRGYGDAPMDRGY